MLRMSAVQSIMSTLNSKSSVVQVVLADTVTEYVPTWSDEVVGPQHTRGEDISHS